MSRPGGIRYQLWPQLAFVFVMFFVAASWALLNLTWSWGSPDSWGTFKDHQRYLLSAFGYLVPFLSGEDWNRYWNTLAEHHLIETFIVHLMAPLIASAALAWYLAKRLLWVDGGRELLVHIKGPKLLQGSEAIRHAKKMHRIDLRSDKRSTTGVKIHPNIPITTSREQNNMFILGTTGAGKSMVFKPIVQQAIDRGDRAVIYDEKGEYTQEFYDKNKTILVAPWDARSIRWDISADIRSRQDVFVVANCMLPSDREKDKVWIKGARLLFAGMIISLVRSKKPWGWPDLYNLLQSPEEDILDLLQKHLPIARSLIQEGSKTTQGFYVNLVSELSWIEDLAIAWPQGRKPAFSIRKWVHDNNAKKVLIIQSDTRFDSIGAPLCSTIISLMSRYYLALEDNLQSETWLFIDEFANLPPNLSIKKWLELARSRGARSVLCTQSISQLIDIYGKADTDTLLNLLSIVISLRVGAGGDDAKYASQIFSERIVERPNTHDTNSTWQRSREPLVDEFDITQLKTASWRGVDGYLFIPGWEATFKLRWPIFKGSKNAKKHIPAKWLKSSTNKTAPTIINANRFRRRRVIANNQPSK